MLCRTAPFVGIAAGVASCSVSFAGPLTPPAGPVAPTPKPLTEVEPRIALTQDNTPGDDDSVFRIAAPGSYYLTEDLLGEENKLGIEVAADGVTIDLNGFTLQGKPLTLAGIGVDPDEFNTYRRIAIFNGTIAGWGDDGIDGFRFFEAQVRDLIARENSNTGIRLNNNSIVENCMSNNNTFDGFVLERSNLIQNCSAASNGRWGIRVNFINIIRNCVSTLNGDDGFNTGIGNLIENNIAESNIGDGFDVFHDNVVRNNYAYRNGAGSSATGFGFYTNDQGSQFEGNLAAENDDGFRITSTGNLVIRNSARGSTNTDYNIVGGNTVGPFVNSATIAGSSNPHANYIY